MTLEEITLALFTTCNSLRIVAYVPQALKAAAIGTAHRRFR